MLMLIVDFRMQHQHRIVSHSLCEPASTTRAPLLIGLVSLENLKIARVVGVIVELELFMFTVLRYGQIIKWFHLVHGFI